MKHKIFGLCLVLVTVLFFSCSPEVGLFFSIESEVPPSVGTLPEGLSAKSLAADSDDVMLLAAGGLYVLDPASAEPETWVTVDKSGLPDTLSSSLALSAACYNDVFYVCFTSSEGDANGLYSTDDPTLSTVAWTLVSDVPGVEYILSAGNLLFLVGRDASGCSLWSFDGSTYVERLTPAELGSYRRRDIDITTDGTDFWFTWGDTLFSGPAGSMTTADITDLGMTVFSTFGGIYYDLTGSILYVSVNDDDYGYVWTYTSGDGWTASTAELDFLHDFTGFTTGGTDLILVGSDNGYYEMSDPATGFQNPDLSCNYDAYVSIGLYSAVIRSFYVSGTTLKALTLNDGLWTNESGVWSIE